MATRSRRFDSPTVPRRSRRRVPVWGWIVAAIVVVVAISTLAPLVAILALVVLAAALVAVLRGTPTFLRFRSPANASAVLAISAVLFVVSATVAVVGGATRAEQTSQAITLVDSEVADSRAGAGSSPIVRGLTAGPVRVARVDTVTSAVPFEQMTVDDPALPVGQTVVVATGQDGVRTQTWEVVLLDGVEVRRTPTSDAVTTPPIAQVTSVGSYVAPPPEPVEVAAPDTSGCDPNYADACVPVSSDVDCAGGGGNGPAYFDGIARVVGSDVYGLDRDGDGYACEPS